MAPVAVLRSLTPAEVEDAKAWAASAWSWYDEECGNGFQTFGSDAAKFWLAYLNNR